MLKKSITYTNFNGDEETEDFYFNLTKAELIELEMGHDGGLSEALKKIVAAQDGGQIVKEFKEIILKSYGQRSPDGRRFVKTQELRDQFESTEAYSVLFVSLVTDPEVAAEFVGAIMPQDLMKQAQLTMDTDKPKEEMVEESTPTFEPPKEARIITFAEAKALDAAELQAGIASGSLKIKLEQVDIVQMDGDDFTSGIRTGQYVVGDVGPH